MACNSSSKLIDAIQSRCSIIRFSKVSTDAMMERLSEICTHEKVNFDKEGLVCLIELSNGDMRILLNNLQMIHYTFGKVNGKNVAKVVNKPDVKYIDDILNLIVNEGDFDKADKKLTDIINTGFACSDIIKCLFEVIKDFDMDDDKRIKCLSVIGDIQFRVSQGADAYIQLVALISKIYIISN